MVSLPVAKFRVGLIGLGLGAGAGLAACEYPAVSKVEPNPVAYVRPAGAPPIASGSGGLVPYVAITVPPSQQPRPPQKQAPPPALPPSPPPLPARPDNLSWWESLLYGATVGGILAVDQADKLADKALDQAEKLGGVAVDQADKLTKPVPPPVVTVPVYTAPVYGPAGARSGY